MVLGSTPLNFYPVKPLYIICLTGHEEDSTADLSAGLMADLSAVIVADLTGVVSIRRSSKVLNLIDFLG